ncbi:MAG: O-antigen ligase family protein [Colwellia sp.]|nr:O-antigen ligase family protein [Colwellia sp.]
MTREFPQDKETNSNAGFFFLLLYSVALFIRPQEWSYTPDPFPFARVLLILAFIFYLVGQRPKIMGYQGLFLLMLFLLIPISGIRNYDLGEGITQAQNFFTYSFLPFILFAGLVNTPKKQHWVFIIMLVACAVMLHHGLSQKASPDGIGWSGELLSQGTRITFLGFFNDPNDLSMFFIMNIPIAFYLRSLSTNFFIRHSLLLLSIGLVYGVYLANSRGGLIGLMFLSLAFVYFKYGKIKTIFITIIMAPLAYIAMSMFRTIDADESSADGRIEAWYEGIQMFKYRPIFGIGKGQFVDFHGLTAHNSFVLVWAELGVLGYSLWFLTISLTLMLLVGIFNIDKEKYIANKSMLNDIFLAKCLFFSFLGYLSTAFFLSRSYIVFLYVFLGLSYALFCRVKKIDEGVNSININQLTIKLAGLSLLSLIGLYIIITILV